MACRLRLSSLVGRESITGQAVKVIRTIYNVVEDAFYTFLADDGWAIASHIALSILMSMFPFLILVTAIAGFEIGRASCRERV